MGPFHFSSAGITHQEPDHARFSGAKPRFVTGRVDDVDRIAGGVGDDLIEHIRELDFVHFARDVSNVRCADNLFHP